MQICCAKLKNGLYILHTFESKSNHTEIFRVAKPKSNKRQKLSNDNEMYLWHLRLGHISLDRINRLTKDGCNPIKTLYNKIMYTYAQLNVLKIFLYFRDYNSINCAHF